MIQNQTSSNPQAPIVIVGAGLSGLAAALELEAQGESALIFDSASHVGGKVESSVFEDNYILDRGFQVLLPSYPELKRLGNLDYDLDLHYFASGARLETEAGSVAIGNPVQEPLSFLSTALGSYGTTKDKILTLKLQAECFLSRSSASLLERASGKTTRAFLQDYGFSEAMIANFFAPFFSGIFLESQLQTAAGFFLYLFRMFASSPVAVPKFGLGEFPRLLARRLVRSEIRLNTQVVSVHGNRIELGAGHSFEARAILQTTAGLTTASSPGPFGSVTSLWFAAPEPPFEGPWLSLCSRLRGFFINHVAVLSNVSRDYAGRGDALICVNVLGPVGSDVLRKVKDEARTLYGTSVSEWRLLRQDQLDRPLPLYLSGRHDDDTPSQQGAMLRGRRAALELLKTL